LNQTEALKEQMFMVANMKKFNKREPEELNHQIQNAGGSLLALCLLLDCVAELVVKTSPNSRKTNITKSLD